MKLTKLHRRILTALRERCEDLYDLADALKEHPVTVFKAMVKLRDGGLIDWMYPEDQASLAPAGRAALQEATHETSQR